MPSAAELRELKAKLVIDDDDLDACLVEQPGYFFNAAEAVSAANAARDMVKLELKELAAQLDQDIRRNAIETGEKLSETLITNRITILPNVKALNRRYLALCKEADDYAALKDAYIQRSYALKDLNARQINELNNLAVERGSTGARQSVGERARARAEETRRQQRSEGQPRYRAQDRGD